MKKTLFAALVALPALFAVPANAVADGPGAFTVVVRPALAGHGHPAYGRPPVRHLRPYVNGAWRPLPGNGAPRFGHRVVRPYRSYRPYRHYRPYRFVLRFD